METKINVAGPKQNYINRLLYKAAINIFDAPEDSMLLSLLSGKDEYMRGVSQNVVKKLKPICDAETAELECITGINLADWYVSADTLSHHV